MADVGPERQVVRQKEFQTGAVINGESIPVVGRTGNAVAIAADAHGQKGHETAFGHEVVKTFDPHSVELHSGISGHRLAFRRHIVEETLEAQVSREMVAAAKTKNRRRLEILIALKGVSADERGNRKGACPHLRMPCRNSRQQQGYGKEYNSFFHDALLLISMFLFNNPTSPSLGKGNENHFAPHYNAHAIQIATINFG